jgi:hypothetical protein
MNDPLQRSRSKWILISVAGFVVIWFALAEISTEAWYYVHESKLKRNPALAEGAEIVRRLRQRAEQNGTFQIKEQDIGSAATDILKCSYGKTLTWVNDQGVAAVTVLRWGDRSTAGGVESSHNPGGCLAAAGWTVGAQTDLGFEDYYGTTAYVTEWQVRRPDIEMLAYSAVFRRFAGAPIIERKTSRNDLRLGAVWSGRRDAPVLVILVYLPGDPSEVAAKREQFKEIMQAALHSDKVSVR